MDEHGRAGLYILTYSIHIPLFISKAVVYLYKINTLYSYNSSRTLLNCAMKSLPVQFDNIETTSVSISEVLKEVSAILSRVDCSPSVRREVMLKTAVLKDQWEQIQLLYERRCTELNHGNSIYLYCIVAISNCLNILCPNLYEHV